MTSYSVGCFLWVAKRPRPIYVSRVHVIQFVEQYILCPGADPGVLEGGDRNFQNVTSKKNKKKSGEGGSRSPKSQVLRNFQTDNQKKQPGGGGN